MAGDLFEGLPPPSSSSLSIFDGKKESELLPITSPPAPIPVPIIKSALKRPKPIESNPQDPAPAPEKKKLRFKMTTEASEKQVIDVMQKITYHIKNPAKFGKASKLAIQLIRAGSVKPGNVDCFFTILETAMLLPTSCNDPSMRLDYHSLFTAANEVSECLSNKQKNQLKVWTIMAVVANDLFTDDSFMFSKTASHVKELISDLPLATQGEDKEEAEAVKDELELANEDGQIKQKSSLAALGEENTSAQESDPFGLDALIPSAAKKAEKTKGKSKIKEEEEEDTKRFLKSQRQTLISCLEIAAKRYKTAWCQTVIDILVRHAFDNVARFTALQRDAIDKLWASIREQQTRRKHGKSVTGKLDVNGFERLQQKYANEKISIRRAVGGSGARRAQQWLG